VMKKEKLGRNDPCHCGSGLKYKKCHFEADLKEGKVYYKQAVQVPTSKATLDENTLDFISYLREIFGIVFDSKKGVGAVLGEVTKEKVRSLYETLPIYFPHKASFRDICFDISNQSFSGLYWGTPDINSIASYLARYTLYTPNTIITNPFCDLMIYHRDASPIDRPEAWMQVTMNQALFLVSIEPWIKEGIISVLPPLRWFDPEFFDKELVKVSERRVNSYNESEKKRLMSSIYIEMLKKFRPEHVDSFLRLSIEDSMPPGFLKAAQDLVEIEYKRNPIRYAWNVPPEGYSSILKTGSGNSLESAMFTADLCDAYILFGEEHYRHEYDMAIEMAGGIQDDSLTQMSRAFADLEFSFLNAVRLDFVLSLRKDGRLARLRNFLIKVWDKTSLLENIGHKNLYKIFKDELEEQYEDYKREWADITTTLNHNITSTVIGSGIAVLSGQIGFKVAGGGVAAFGIKQLLEAYDKRRKQKRLPLGIFLDLEKQNKKK